MEQPPDYNELLRKLDEKTERIQKEIRQIHNIVLDILLKMEVLIHPKIYNQDYDKSKEMITGILEEKTIC